MAFMPISGGYYPAPVINQPVVAAVPAPPMPPVPPQPLPPLPGPSPAHSTLSLPPDTPKAEPQTPELRPTHPTPSDEDDGEPEKTKDGSPLPPTKGKQRQVVAPIPSPAPSPSSIPFPYDQSPEKQRKKSKATGSRELRALQRWEWSEEPEQGPAPRGPTPNLPERPRRNRQLPREFWKVDGPAQPARFDGPDDEDDSPPPSGGARNRQPPSDDEGDNYVPSDEGAALVQAAEIVYPAEELLTFEQAAERAYSELACKVAADNTEPKSFREAC
ncbi:hypothetical protein FRB90_010521 [Tulasnella sp. 427]|nr:hypothetical protein FRB90_010521 [Tulasnella sp. 427]